MINYNAFILSHTSLPADIPSQQEIDKFVSTYQPGWKLDVNNPITFGNIIGTTHYEKVRKDMQRAQDKALNYIKEISKEWEKTFGRFHGDLIEKFHCDDAEYILLAMGAIGAESKAAIELLRSKGIKIGLARVRVFRPFPTEEIRQLAQQAELIIIDRNISIGNEGALSTEIKAALYGTVNQKITSYIAGLGGKDVPYTDIVNMCEKAIKKTVKKPIWYGFEKEA
jgi:pyruvate/2-oxoacid:ferredoxin oxidoreductase alpha subunit